MSNTMTGDDPYGLLDPVLPEPQTNVNPANMAEGAQLNPANAPSTPDPIAGSLSPARARVRIPMSTPTRKLEVQEIPGYRLYWHKQENVERALQAGYEFVTKGEVVLNRNSIGGQPGADGNTDLGTHVSVVGGRTEGGEPQRLVLMKLALEYFKADQMSIAMNNAAKLANIFDSEEILGQGGQIEDSGRYNYTPSEGKSLRARGRREFQPVFNRSKRTAVIGRGPRYTS